MPKIIKLRKPTHLSKYAIPYVIFGVIFVHAQKVSEKLLISFFEILDVSFCRSFEIIVLQIQLSS